MKQILLSLALLTGATAVQAQSTNGSGTRFGLKVGVVAASLAGDDKDFQGDVQNRFGFQAGITTTTSLGVGGLFELHPELLYSQRGYQIEDVSKTTFHNLDVPLLARLNAAGFVVEVGPQVGYLFARKTKFDDSAMGDITNRGQLNKLQFGYIVGVGYQLESGPNVGVRYNRSITKLYDGDAALPGGNKIYNSVFQFQLGFAFPGNK
ncbi:PorT family protein [Hymenobacter sp. HSC-4F20]|uniref:porin family protein n=1 Tax=Hymenobacter sp. HSC-4F20 TaxID=2864135 RepID=UPI001C72DE8B|nr:porin family protein [Hymenobacter sp. HSC-4F20]MBX0293095.1 PorT family protein [Hymenobacter sp. HSC-4F20]